MPNKILVNTLTAICAIAPDNQQLWNLSEDESSLNFWEKQDVHARKRMFISKMINCQLTEDKQLIRVAALCREHVLKQFPVFSEVLNCSEFSWSRCMMLISVLGPEIKVEPLPEGVYKHLAGFQEHQFRSCASVEEVLALNEKLTAQN